MPSIREPSPTSRLTSFTCLRAQRIPKCRSVGIGTASKGSRVEYRDSRTVFFQQRFERGRYEFNYLVKVTSAGQFRAVPAQAAPMYVPGVAASSEPQLVTVAAPPGSTR
ncbi:MAG: hypothetical protein ABR606_04585 [Vicinamibacterales bacterium]